MAICTYAIFLVQKKPEFDWSNYLKETIIYGEQLFVLFCIKRKMMGSGASKHWKHSLKILTGENMISTNALFEYFGPLIEWLHNENSKYPNDPPGFE